MTSIIITLLFVLYKIPLINILGDKGMGYYSTAFVIYLLFMTFIAYGMPKALASTISGYRAKGQYALLNHTVKTAFFSAFVTGIILTVILLIGADVIAAYVLKAAYSSYAIRGIALCMIPASLSGVIHGVFAGTKLTPVSKRAVKAEEFLTAVLSICGVLLFMKLAPSFVSSQNDPALLYAFRSMGATLGLSIAAIFSFILLFIYYKDYANRLERFARKDAAKITQTKRSTYKQILISMMPFALTLFIFHASSLMDYAVFNRIMSVQGHKESSYIILLGMLNGKYEFFISIPILIASWFITKKTNDFKEIVEEGNKRKLLSKISQTIRIVMLFILPCTAVYIVFSTPLMNLLFTGMNETPSLLLKTGAVSIIFYILAVISNTILHVLDDWFLVAKNAVISLVIQLIALLFMMIIFKWGILAVVFSRIIFAAALFMFNEHSLRERTGYVQDYKKTFFVPAIASVIMSVISFWVYFIFELMIPDKFACLLAIVIAIPAYIMALVFLGGITQREMYALPGGKYLAPLCKKLHLIK